jgi:hypothetical protein
MEESEATGISNKKIGDTVWLYFFECGKIGPCEIAAITYTNYGKVKYDVMMKPFKSEPQSADLTTIVSNIDSYFVKTESEIILLNKVE